MRNKFKGKGKLTAKIDMKIWQYEAKTLISDLTYSLTEVSKIVTLIEKLEKECHRNVADLETNMNRIKEDLR